MNTIIELSVLSMKNGFSKRIVVRGASATNRFVLDKFFGGVLNLI